MHFPSHPPIPMPEWVVEIIEGGFSILGILLLILFWMIPAIIFYLVTLSYGWLPNIFLKRKRHLLWLLPLLSTGALFGLLLPYAMREEGMHFAPTDIFVLAECAFSAFLAALTILGGSKLMTRLRALIRRKSPNKRMNADQ